MEIKRLKRKKLETSLRKTLSVSAEENISYFKKLFGEDDTLIIRYFENVKDPEVKGYILFINGMVNREEIFRSILEPVIQNPALHMEAGLLKTLQDSVISAGDIEKTGQINKIMNSLLNGNTIFILNAFNEAFVINTKGFQMRSITEPEGERVLRGPREGFIEPLLVNLTLLRRKLETADLKYEFMKIGRYSQTKLCICYISGVANPQIVKELKQRLKKIDIDGIVASGYIVELIKDEPYSPFKTMGSTERPDVVAAKLLEGRVAVVVDGTPVVITLPFLFIEHFQANEDYYINFYFSTINRLLRIIAFMITVSVPGVYVALLTFHQEMIPTPLLLSISSARQGVPLPTIVEILILLFVFEILREAGIRMSNSIGQALSIVGALVLGQASVDAKLVSAPVVIVVALSGITGLITPRIKGAAITFRLLLLLLSAYMGLYGFIFGVSGILIHLCQIRTFGIPYLIDLASMDLKEFKDTAIRAPLWFMNKRPLFMSNNRTRQGNTGRRK